MSMEKSYLQPIKVVTLHAEFEDGIIISGESKIPSYGQKIKRVFITPDRCETAARSINAIKNADIIAIGPGSLYTSILPNLLVDDIRKAIMQSKCEESIYL